eukprot:1973482-Rhodomonas_salina.3
MPPKLRRQFAPCHRSHELPALLPRAQLTQAPQEPPRIAIPPHNLRKRGKEEGSLSVLARNEQGSKHSGSASGSASGSHRRALVEDGLLQISIRVCRDRHALHVRSR